MAVDESTDYVYIAGVDSPDDLDTGECVLFRVPATHREDWHAAEAFGRDLRWIPSDSLSRYRDRGSTDMFEPVEITPEQAAAVIQQKRRRALEKSPRIRGRTPGNRELAVTGGIGGAVLIGLPHRVAMPAWLAATVVVLGVLVVAGFLGAALRDFFQREP